MCRKNEFTSFEVYCITLSAHFVKKKNTLKSNIIYNSASRVIRTHLFTSSEIESFALRHRLKNWKMERNCSFQRLVGGQCGKDPRSTKVQDLVPLLTCNKDISRHKSSLGLMTGSGVDTEVELILARSSIFSSLPIFLTWIFLPLIVLRWALGGEAGIRRVAVYQLAQLSKHVCKSGKKG